MAKGFVGAIKRHRLAIEALRRCYRKLSERIWKLEKFAAAAEPILVDLVAGRIPDSPPPRKR